ncbi:MAG: leucine-rich repeat domain-containing protein [Prevotellaceae bacterium]|nr:leucine-rich repeat domain-containing protein [Prevotellaceae bacterium]
MKRFLFLCLAALTLQAPCFAYDAYVDGIYYNLDTIARTFTVTFESYSLSENYYNYGSPYTGSVDIPSTVEYHNTSYPVTSIGSSAFCRCSSLTSVTIPNSVTSIESNAFGYCTGLASITIPNSVTNIGDGAFGYCASLASITIPNSVTSIGDGAFYSCGSLTSITIPESVASIAADAFGYCSSLASITIPNSVTSIGNWAFEFCASLTSITIPNSVTSIGDGAFCGCGSLSSVTSLSLEPPTCWYDVFSGVDTSTCTLIVPEGSKAAYAAAYGWSDFLNIKEYDTTGVQSVSSAGEAKGSSFFTLDGKQVNAPQKGVNIIRYSDGTVRKVLVK